MTMAMTPRSSLDPVRYRALSERARLRIAAEREAAEIASLPLRPYPSAEDLVAASQARGRDRLARIAAITDYAEHHPTDGVDLTGMSRQQRRDLLANAAVWPDGAS